VMLSSGCRSSDNLEFWVAVSYGVELRSSGGDRNKRSGREQRRSDS
jgi:hypothetical protein